MTSHRLLVVALLAACTTTSIPEDAEPAAQGGKADGAGATLPAGLPAWGGDDATRWTPEAVLANAVTLEFQRDPAARVSVPVALARSTFAPFGDGQTNVAASFVSWHATRPPVVGIRHAASIEVRFDRALPIGDATVELWSATGTWMRSLPAMRTTDGDLAIEIADPALLADLGDRFAVSPRGWRDRFALSFTIPITTIDTFIAALPTRLRTLPGGEPVVDPVGAHGDDALATLRATSFPAGFTGQTPYVTDTLHAAFPQGGTPRITAVGGALTWVATDPFENLYVCLDPRDRAREAAYGVPSGAGWHHIGDLGESIVASLTTSPLLVGYAEDVPAIGADAVVAYGLTHAATFALLAPGASFTSPRSSFHWYAVHQATAPCVQIWKHACVPDPRSPSMACPE